ncbi:MAG TPA: alpha/beta hydrolase fold domain-containing protein [Phenylobacterium sp.]|jgi:acetyl esterase/lipase|nr:alpha/beta hydrolase fold domain-containing protein [Phenylobacterium sp.]
MRHGSRLFAGLAAALFWAPGVALAQPPAQLPDALSQAMRDQLAHPLPALDSNPNVAERRAMSDKIQADLGAKLRQTYAVEITEGVIAGVPVRHIAPKVRRGTKAVLLDLHGGGFQIDSGGMTETIPLAALTGVEVVAVRYRMAPEHLFPAAVDDALAVYRELLKTHSPRQIVVYGTSAGAILGPQLILRLRREHLPLPAAVGVFAGDADFARTADSERLLGMGDLNKSFATYMGAHAATDPLVSPIYGDLHGFPPTYCVTSTRDFLMGPTVDFCRALDRAGVTTKLTVFDGLPHAFWAYMLGPEEEEANQDMAAWMRGVLGVK